MEDNDKYLKIQEKLQKHLQELYYLGYQKDSILGIFLYGSQNYGVDLETSDVDTKVIYIPSYDELCFQEKRASREHIIKTKDGEEKCEVKDIREMVKMFKKQNINFVEILFTQYYIINPNYESIWNEYFINNRESIAAYDKNYTVASICGQAIHTLMQNKTDGKKIANAIRLKYFLQQYLFTNATYLESITVPEPLAEIIKYLKKGNIKIETSEIAVNLINWFQNTKTKFLEENCGKPSSQALVREKVDEAFRNGIRSAIDLRVYNKLRTEVIKED